MKKLKEKIIKLKKILKEIDKRYSSLIEEFECLLLQTENFKLHDLSFYLYNDKNNNLDAKVKDELFSEFTFWEFERFLDIFNNDIKLQQIGRTSSNFITSGYFSENWLDLLPENRQGIYSNTTLYDIIDRIDYIDLGLYIIDYLEYFLNRDGSVRDLKDIVKDFNTIEIANETIDELLEVLEQEYLMSDYTYNNIKAELDTLIEVWDYIENFKNNQVEFFIEFKKNI